MKKKKRIRISPALAAEIMFEHDQTCCVCNIRGKAVQIHHIDEDPSNNDKDNLSVLCLEDHDDTQIKGGFGRKLSAPIVVKYRNDWVARVKSRRAEADRIAIDALKQAQLEQVQSMEQVNTSKLQSREAQFIESLPKAYRGAKDLVADGFSGNTIEMRQSGYELVDILTKLWIRLVSLSNIEDFDGDTPEIFLSSYITNRFSWHRTLSEPDGPGTGGTMVGLQTIAGVIGDLESAITETVSAMFDGDDYESYTLWEAGWKSSCDYHP